MIILCLLTIALGLFAIGSFTWAMFGYFRKPKGKSTWALRWLKISASFTALFQGACLLFPGNVTGPRTLWGIIFFTASLALFWWSIRCQPKKSLAVAFSDGPEGFNDHGPYRLVRHPFYTAYMLTWLGGILATGNMLLWSTVILMGYHYYRAARREEEQFSQSPFAAKYAQYKASTGMFFPSPSAMLPHKRAA